jgi:competence protein ComEA
VNINTADSETLQTLNGVGPATAEKIISYRKENGRFKSVEDIKNVSGIGDKTYEKLKDYIRT